MKTIIPEAALEQHIAVLGKTGSGKTYTAKGAIVEPLLARGAHVCVVDPTDAWWGLRSSRDGKGPGFKVLILGGDNGDLPLPANGGAALARMLIEQRINMVICTKHLTVGERTRWSIDFFGTLNRLNRQPLHLVIDEAHNFAPQGKVPDPDTGKMLHAVNALAAEGRSKGIRLTMLTQRPQKLHKDTLTCAETLIAMRVLAPHDRLAVEDWIKGCGDLAQGKEVLNSLAGLQRGEGWVWYPEGAHIARVKFPAIKTFDSSATPTGDHQVTAPKGAAEIDLTEIRKALADAVKEAEANDPKLLRAENAKLRTELGKKPVYSQVPDAATIERAEASGYSRGREEGAREGYQMGLKALQPIADRVGTLASGITETIEGYRQDLQRLTLPPIKARHPAPPPPAPRPGAVAKHSAQFANLSKLPSSAHGAAIPKAERLILTALAQYQDGRSKVQVAVLTGYAVNGGGFANALGSLRSAGRIEGSSDRLTITENGLNDLGPFEPLPRGAALLEHWYRQLGKAEKKALEALVEVYPRTLSKAQMAARAGYEADGGGFNNALGRLRSLELISGRGEMKASEDLFG